MAAKVTWCQEWMSRSGEAMNLAKQMLHSQDDELEGRWGDLQHDKSPIKLSMKVPTSEIVLIIHVDIRLCYFFSEL